MDQQLLQQTLNFVERVTHWKEGGPDCHDTLVALRAAIAQPLQPATNNFEMTASRIELLATMLHCVPTDESELFKDLNAFCHDARAAFNKAAIAQPALSATAPLAPEDYSAIRAKLCEANPGDWLHHYGPAVEAEILKRLRVTA